MSQSTSEHPPGGLPETQLRAWAAYEWAIQDVAEILSEYADLFIGKQDDSPFGKVFRDVEAALRDRLGMNNTDDSSEDA